MEKEKRRWGGRTPALWRPRHIPPCQIRGSQRRASLGASPISELVRLLFDSWELSLQLSSGCSELLPASGIS